MMRAVMKNVLGGVLLVGILVGVAVLYKWSFPTSVPRGDVTLSTDEQGSTPPPSVGPDIVPSTTTTPPFATLNTPYELEGVTVVLTEIIEDSRCPSDVTCIQAGTVRVRGLLSDSEGSSERAFVLGEATTFRDRSIVLREVLPPAISTTSIEAGEYQFYFVASK